MRSSRCSAAFFSAALLALLLSLLCCSRAKSELGPETRAALRPVDAASAVASSVRASPDLGATKKTGPSDVGNPIDVSIIQLIATPERYRGARVRLVGYAVAEFEGDAVYLHRDDYQEQLTRNGLWLDWADASEEAKAGRPRDPGYAIIEGKFDPDHNGHMSLFSGALHAISRCSHFSNFREKNSR